MSATLAAPTQVGPRGPLLRKLARASGMLLLCSVGALATTYAHYAVLAAIGGFRAEDPWAPWREAWLGGFFWPGAILGTLWAWSWSIAYLWNRRWIRAAILITSGSLVITLLIPLLGIGLLPVEFLWITCACIVIGGARWSAKD